MTVTGRHVRPDHPHGHRDNAPAVLQPVSAEVLQGFVKVYQAYVEGGATPQNA